MPYLLIPIFVVEGQSFETARPRSVLVPIRRHLSASSFVHHKLPAKLLKAFCASLVIGQDNQMPAFRPLHDQPLDDLLIELQGCQRRRVQHDEGHLVNLPGR